MSSVGCWPKPSQLAVTVGKGALQLRPDKQHPPSDRVARSKVRQNIFISIGYDSWKQPLAKNHPLSGAT